MRRIEIAAERDETGRWEEFGGDLCPLVPFEATVHLAEDGLPQPGTLLRPGMPVVGKIGRSKTFDPAWKQDRCEWHLFGVEWANARYGHMWRDGSYYATAEVQGVVKSAKFVTDREGRQIAIVEWEDDVSTMDATASHRA